MHQQRWRGTSCTCEISTQDIVSIGDWELDYHRARPGGAWTKNYIAGLR